MRDDDRDVTKVSEDDNYRGVSNSAVKGVVKSEEAWNRKRAAAMECFMWRKKSSAEQVRISRMLNSLEDQ